MIENTILLIVFSILLIVLVVLIVHLNNSRKKIKELDQNLTMLRRAKAMDEREIAQLKEKILVQEEQHLELVQANQNLEATFNELKVENNKLRGD